MNLTSPPVARDTESPKPPPARSFTRRQIEHLHRAVAGDIRGADLQSITAHSDDRPFAKVLVLGIRIADEARGTGEIGDEIFGYSGIVAGVDAAAPA